MNQYELHLGDCLEVLKGIPDNCLDSIVTDPPYGISFMNKRWDYDVPPVAVWQECLRVLKPGGHLLAFAGTRTQHRMACRIEDAGFEIRDMLAWLYGSGFPKARTMLKPALEPITMARKPFKGSLTANMQAHSTGGLNIEECRVDSGRWPANLMHDGSYPVVALFPAEAGASAPVRGTEPSPVTDEIYGKFAQRVPGQFYGDSGSAARFFYCAKTSPTDRHEGLERPGPQFSHGTTLRKVENTTTAGNNHPTVKPTDLMAHLVKLVTPAGGTVLDPFMGSGSTGKAAIREGFNFIGIELDEGYLAIARQRLTHEARKHAQ